MMRIVGKAAPGQTFQLQAWLPQAGEMKAVGVHGRPAEAALNLEAWEARVLEPALFALNHSIKEWPVGPFTIDEVRCQHKRASPDKHGGYCIDCDTFPFRDKKEVA